MRGRTVGIVTSRSCISWRKSGGACRDEPEGRESYQRPRLGCLFDCDGMRGGPHRGADTMTNRCRICGRYMLSNRTYVCRICATTKRVPWSIIGELLRTGILTKIARRGLSVDDLHVLYSQQVWEKDIPPLRKFCQTWVPAEYPENIRVDQYNLLPWRSEG